MSMPARCADVASRSSGTRWPASVQSGKNKQQNVQQSGRFPLIGNRRSSASGVPWKSIRNSSYCILTIT
jgi:hypothetical protein